MSLRVITQGKDDGVLVYLGPTPEFFKLAFQVLLRILHVVRHFNRVLQETVLTNIVRLQLLDLGLLHTVLTDQMGQQRFNLVLQDAVLSIVTRLRRNLLWLLLLFPVDARLPLSYLRGCLAVCPSLVWYMEEQLKQETIRESTIVRKKAKVCSRGLL